jgi:hypothetical protein
MKVTFCDRELHFQKKVPFVRDFVVDLLVVSVLSWLPCWYPPRLIMRATTQAVTTAEEGAEEQRRKIEAAERATRERQQIPLMVSRQDYIDLLEAYRFLRQTSPWLKSVGKRLDKLAVRIRDGLDQAPGGAHQRS